MKTISQLILCGLLLAGVLPAQATKPKEERRTVHQLLEGNVANFEHEFVPAAEAMPEDKFNFVPTSGEFKGVRTFAQQIKHVAAVNYELAAAIMEQKEAGARRRSVAVEEEWSGVRGQRSAKPFGADPRRSPASRARGSARPGG